MVYNSILEFHVEFHEFLEILLGLLTHSSFGFGWPALGINILEILINSVYMVLMIVISNRSKTPLG